LLLFYFKNWGYLVNLKYCFISCAIVLSSIGFCEESCADKARAEANEKLESGFEKTALGTLEIAVGVFYATKGDVAVATGATMHGVYVIKEGISDFKEAKQLFESAREIEREIELNDLTYGVHDREY
jgi:hypothetical protein